MSTTNIPKVSNMTSPRTGSPVANQFEIRTDGAVFFQSYDTIIAVIKHDDVGDTEIVLDKDSWDYSTTTGKYRNQFLNEGIAETRKKIANGTYKLEDLN